MEKKFKDLKKRLERADRIYRSGHDESLRAGITDDLSGIYLKDLPTGRKEEITAPETNIYHLRGPFACDTIITGPMRELMSSYVADIKYVLSGVLWDEGYLRDVEIARIHVRTPVAARFEPRVTIDDGAWDELVRNVESGAPIKIVAEDAQRLMHEDHAEWVNVIPFKIGGGGLLFDGMCTTIPIHKKGGAAFDSIVLGINAVRVLLTLLNGGHKVDVHSVGTAIEGEKNTVDLSFPLRSFDILAFGLDGYHRNRLRTFNGLDLIGMKGVADWVEWHSRFRNRHVLEHWLYSDDFLASFIVLEGLGRIIKRDDEGYQSDVIFRKALNAVLRKTNMSGLVDSRTVKALSEVNNKLVKHIGDLPEESDGAFRYFAGPASVFASFLVGYTLLRVSIGNLPGPLDRLWRKEIEDCYRKLPDIPSEIG